MRKLICLVVLLGWAPLSAAQSLLVLGDSISAAYGIDKQQGWVTLLQRRLDDKCPGWTVNNASVSGETSSGGLARLPGLLERHQPNLMLLELGGNDGLRGQRPAQMRANLIAMIDMAQQQGSDVVLLGMRIPPNYGEAYNQLFEQVFADVAEKQQVPLIPFFLEGVAGEAGLMQDDGIHPTAEGQPLLLENAWGEVWRKVERACES